MVDHKGHIITKQLIIYLREELKKKKRICKENINPSMVKITIKWSITAVHNLKHTFSDSYINIGILKIIPKLQFKNGNE